MHEDPLQTLSDIASDEHARIQTAHQSINPVVEVRRGMRDAGIPADMMVPGASQGAKEKRSSTV